MKQVTTPFTSSCLSSGWVSLRMNGRITPLGRPERPETRGGHQHADRLGLTLYNQGELLALEKATPYNESVTRVLGTET